jgi:hypothetical protein
MDVVADIRMIVGLKFQNRKKSLGGWVGEGEFSRKGAKTQRGREIE